MLKKLLHKFINKAGYSLNKISLPPNEEEIIERGKSIIQNISPEFQVLNGPFKGLKYPSLNITEATLVPKIVGSYEAHLHPLIEKIIQTPYTDIIDVGCAEGYYAVGFAMKMPKATIHCFDINEKDLDFCQKMAHHNNLNNITFNQLCSPEKLISFPFRGRGLIFCDCEGYELDLFTEEVINNLINVDVLVELHDVLNPIISSEILTRFQHTHNFQVINNLNVDLSTLSGIDQLSDEDKVFSTFEHRGGLYQNIFMEWAFITSKENKTDVN